MTAQLEPVGERTVIETSGGPVSALQAGTVGEPVLLVPGYTGSKEDFAPILPLLLASGFALTAIDLPGQYESPGPADPDEYRPARLAEVVGEVAAVLGGPSGAVHLLGHSFGGLVARAAVLAEPSAYRSLVLMSSGPSGIDGARRAMIEQLEPVLAASGMAGVYAASLAVYRAQAGYVEPPAPLAAFLERRFLAGAPAMLQGMGRALRDEPDRVAELAAVGVPTLVMYGVDDDAWPPHVQDDMARRLQAEVAVVADAAHSPAVENPVATATALTAFWQRQAAQTAPSSPAHEA
jgi:pimeloyl-ACP methyl ester carboxylesterase